MLFFIVICSGKEQIALGTDASANCYSATFLKSNERNRDVIAKRLVTAMVCEVSEK